MRLALCGMEFISTIWRLQTVTCSTFVRSLLSCLFYSILSYPILVFLHTVSWWELKNSLFIICHINPELNLKETDIHFSRHWGSPGHCTYYYSFLWLFIGRIMIVMNKLVLVLQVPNINSSWYCGMFLRGFLSHGLSVYSEVVIGIGSLQIFLMPECINPV